MGFNFIVLPTKIVTLLFSCCRQTGTFHSSHPALGGPNMRNVGNHKTPSYPAKPSNPKNPTLPSLSICAARACPLRHAANPKASSRRASCVWSVRFTQLFVWSYVLRAYRRIVVGVVVVVEFALSASFSLVVVTVVVVVVGVGCANLYARRASVVPQLCSTSHVPLVAQAEHI